MTMIGPAHCPQPNCIDDKKAKRSKCIELRKKEKEVDNGNMDLRREKKA